MRSNGEDQSDRGQATVEFALVLPLLVICIAGLVWVGQLVTMQVRLEHAAREGARAAAVEPERATAVAANAVSRTVSNASTSTRIDGDFVIVEVSARVSGVPFIGLGERTLSADAHMRREDILGIS